VAGRGGQGPARPPETGTDGAGGQHGFGPRLLTEEHAPRTCRWHSCAIPAFLSLALRRRAPVIHRASGITPCLTRTWAWPPGEHECAKSFGCCAICSNNHACKTWVFHAYSTECALKKPEVSKRSSKANVVSGSAQQGGRGTPALKAARARARVQTRVRFQRRGRTSPIGFGSKSPSPREIPIGFGPRNPSPRASPIGCGPRSPSPRASPIGHGHRNLLDVSQLRKDVFESKTARSEKI
jgi:hypothetical protein